MSCLYGGAALLRLAANLVALVPLPGTSSVSVPLSPPSECEECHGGFDSASPFDTWAGSAMGHAARDPVFLAALTVAEQDLPGAGDLCLRCHAPEAWLSGRSVPADGSGLEPSDSGVTCSVCHRMLPSPFVRNAQLVVADDSAMRGPFSSWAIAPHPVQMTDFLADARACGVCHDVMNPLVSRKAADGADTREPFPEQATYSEWAASAFPAEGVTCQRCHMQESEGPVAENGPDHADRSEHGFAGGNLFLLDAIEVLEPDLGLSEKLSQGRARIRDTLRRAARIDVVSSPGVIERDRPFSITVKITNLTGHKLPTGLPEGRRVFLAARSEPLGLSRGALDEVTGEPVAPIAVYQAVHGRSGIGPGHHLALNDTIYSDTRIPPRGFVTDATIAPVGKMYRETAPGSGVLVHFDEVTITATAPPALAEMICASDSPPPPIGIDLELYHQPATKRMLDALIAANGSDARGARLATVLGAAAPRPALMTSVRVGLVVSRESFCGAPDAGAIDAGPGDGGLDAAGSDVELTADGGAGAGGDVVGETPDAPRGCGCAAGARPAEAGDVSLALLALLISSSWRCRRGASARRRC